MATFPYGCAICYQLSPCSKCQISRLQQQNDYLHTRLKFYERNVPPIFNVSDFSNKFQISDQYIKISLLANDLPSYRFLTITFDPTKFGHFNPIHAEQKYILYALYKSYKSNKIKQMSGCFEFQKNGTTHAHVLIRTSETDKDIQDYLRPLFTDSKRNQRAVLCVPARFPQVIEYIKKESDSYFAIDHDSGHDLDIVEEEQVNKIIEEDKNKELVKIIEEFSNEIKPKSAVQNRIDYYNKEINKYKQLIAKEEATLNGVSSYN